MEKKDLTSVGTRSAGALDTLINGMSGEVFRQTYDAFLNELKDVKLDLEKVKLYAAKNGVERDTVESWRSVSDLFKHFDSAELVRKYPQQARLIMTSVMMLIPYANVVSIASSVLPDEAFAKIQETLHKLTPDHIASVLIEKRVKTLETRQALYDEPDCVAEGMVGFAVVTGDALLYETAAKLLHECAPEFQPLRWDEKKYDNRRNAGELGVQALVLGRKATDPDVQLMDVLFDSYGVKCGVKDGTAFITCDLRRIRAKGLYDEFLKELAALPLPESVKADKKLRLNWKTGLKAALATPLIAKDIYDDSAEVKRQMLFYGAARYITEYLASEAQSAE